MTPDDPQRGEFDRRRRTRSIVTAVLLLGMVVMFYFITLARIESVAT